MDVYWYHYRLFDFYLCYKLYVIFGKMGYLLWNLLIKCTYVHIWFLRVRRVSLLFQETVQGDPKNKWIWINGNCTFIFPDMEHTVQGYYKWFIRFQYASVFKTNESFIVTLYIVNIDTNKFESRQIFELKQCLNFNIKDKVQPTLVRLHFP
jgi:hypothetical protein